MKPRYILFLMIGIDALILFFQTSNISISETEASLLYGDFSFLQLLINTSLKIFGQNDFGLRFVMVTFHLMSVALMYLVSKRYVVLPRNRLLLTLIFILLPGVVSSAIVVNNAGMVIFGLLLFVYLSEKTSQTFLNVLLFLYAIVDIGFAYLFLGLAAHSMFNSKRAMFIYSVALYALTSVLYGFDAFGSPKGHFLDTIGVYGAIFSPIIFIYIFYTLYRNYLTSKIEMLWYISSVALIVSLVLSFRQRIAIEHFAPYLIIALPLSAQLFISSYRVRLREYRKSYKIVFTASLLFLIANTLVVFFNKELYQFMENPKKHFAYKMHIAKDLSEALKFDNINCITTDENMQKRLKFYGLIECKENILTEVELNENALVNVTISYKNKVLYKANVTKINSDKSILY